MTAAILPSPRAPSAPVPRLLAGLSHQRVTSLREHEDRYGAMWLRGPSGRRRPERLIEIVEASGLTGRGGAGFPTGHKMRSVAGRGETAVVANGAEGEPASSKDRLLLMRLPHLVLDGITLAADAVGAKEAYLCLHGREQALLDGLAAAGAALGAGILIALPASSCGLAETARVIRYLADESAGQCGPCLMGLPALASALAGLAFHGGREGAASAVAALIPLIEGRGACRHPDGAARLAHSAIRAFAADACWHDRGGPCDGVRRAPLLPIPGG